MENDKCPETGLPTQALFSPTEVDTFKQLNAKFTDWLSSGRIEHDRGVLAQALLAEGDYGEVMNIVQDEFRDHRTSMTLDDMRTANEWFIWRISGVPF